VPLNPSQAQSSLAGVGYEAPVISQVTGSVPR